MSARAVGFLIIGIVTMSIKGCSCSFQVRHPNILSFLYSTEVETLDSSSTSRITLYMVTEPVMPLSEKIKELGLEGTQRYKCSNLLEA